jgi:hypothetical protein
MQTSVNSQWLFEYGDHKRRIVQPVAAKIRGHQCHLGKDQEA